MCKECEEQFIANGDKMFYDSFDDMPQELKDKFKSKNKGSQLIQAKKGFVNSINELNKNGDILLSSYVNQKTKLKIKRTKCGHITDVKIGNYKRQGCGLCNGHSKEFGKANFFKKLKENKDELIGEYIDSKTHVTIKWHDCGHTTKITPNNYLRDRCCGTCWKEILKSGDIIRDKWENDEEFRQRMIKAIKEWWNTEEGDKQRDIYRDKMKELNDILWNDEDYIQMQRDKMREAWQDEEMRQRFNYKGGITPISTYLRDLNRQWFDDCKKQVSYTCELTGKIGCRLHTHHLYGFNLIVLDAHRLYNIEIHEIIGEYTQEELHKLKEYVASWHRDNNNAVVLCEEVHKLFHNLYGQGDNTPEQFEEFKQRYLNGEFKDLLGDDLNV